MPHTKTNAVYGRPLHVICQKCHGPVLICGSVSSLCNLSPSSVRYTFAHIIVDYLGKMESVASWTSYLTHTQSASKCINHERARALVQKIKLRS